VCRFNENPIPALRFGEVAINMTAAGLFPTGSCAAFGSVFAKTRGSGSALTASLQDVIAPVPMYTSNCLQMAVGYQDNAGGSPSTRPPDGGVSPWGQAGTPGAIGGGVANFVGCNQTGSNCPTDTSLLPPTDGFVYDGGALLFTNTSRAAGVNPPNGVLIPVTFPRVLICVPGARADTCANPLRKAGLAFNCLFDPWGTGSFDVPPGDGTAGSNQTIITQTGIVNTANPPWQGPGTACNVVSAPGNFTENFDTSETVPGGNVVRLGRGFACPQTNSGLIPVIHYQAPGVGGALQDYITRDSDQVLVTGGVDDGCFNINETSQIPNQGRGFNGSGTFVPLT
jgi:hypothetical protein